MAPIPRGRFGFHDRYTAVRLAARNQFGQGLRLVKQRNGIERYHGRYVVRGTDIKFTMYLGTYRDSSYSGTIQSNSLRLVERLTNGSETPPHEYRFVKVSQ